jgi:predicted phage-related endonuclease
MDRSEYLGSHSGSALLGVNPWIGKHDIYMGALNIKEERKEDKLRFDFWYGLQHEALSKAAYERTTGKKVHCEQLFKLSTEHPFMGCHLDGLVLRNDVQHDPNNDYQASDLPAIAERIVEWKTGHPMYFKEWGDGEDQIPEQYYIQCQHMMIVTGLRECDLAVSIGTFFRIYNIKYDEPLAAVIIDAEKKAWAEIAELKVMREKDPKAFATRMCEIAANDEEAKGKIVIHTWKRATLNEEQVPENYYGLFEQMIETNKNLDAETGNWEQLCNKMKLAMGSCERWTGPGGVIEWRNWGQSRRFLVKPNKENQA